MKIGILREEKLPEDHRVVLTPNQCKWIIDNTELEVVVRTSDVRCFTDDEYRELGVPLVDDLSNCDVLIGVKEVPIDNLIENKTYFYFSHTIKGQSYNMSLLQRMLDLNIKMIDYEVLKDEKGKRLIGFGYYAGIVGAYNAFITYGLKSHKFSLKPANKCNNAAEMFNELDKIDLSNERILITGNGKVASGAIEILNKAGIKQVSKDDFLNASYDYPVYCNISTMDYMERIDNSRSSKKDFYSNPDKYKSCFMKFAVSTDIFIAGHFYSEGSPYLFSRDQVRSDDFNIKVVADISCDIDGPVACTIRPSTIENPFYGYNPITEKEDDMYLDHVVAVMAVSNLPCELPKDSSNDFGQVFIDKILFHLLDGDKTEVLKKATICENGDLNDSFEYLNQYL